VRIKNLIVEFLYSHKELTLEGIGTLSIKPSVDGVSSAEKHAPISENVYTFVHDFKAPQDEELIEFIMQHTKKIKSLASADLESYTNLAKQFLNIGKPFVLEGIGTINKNQFGNYEFTAGDFVPVKMEENNTLVMKKNESISNSAIYNKSFDSKKLLNLCIAIALITLISWVVYYFFVGNKTAIFNRLSRAQQNKPSMSAPVIKKVAVMDTLKVKDTVAVTPNKKDSINFFIVIKDYNKRDKANRAFKTLSSYGHHLRILEIDSNHLQLAIPFTKPIQDTTRAKDSIRILLGGHPYIIVN